MRYLIQFLVPALIFVAVLYALTRARRRGPEDAAAADRAPSDTGAFIVILIVSAVVALGTAFALVALWE